MGQAIGIILLILGISRTIRDLFIKLDKIIEGLDNIYGGIEELREDMLGMFDDEEEIDKKTKKSLANKK